MTRNLLGAGVVLSLLAVALRAQAPPQFSVEVEYVEIEARVLDDHGQPIKGLTRDQFQVVEDGAVQNVTAFVAVDLPTPAPAPSSLPSASTTGFVRPDAANNIQQNADGRIFLLLFDDQKIDPGRSSAVRSILRDFVEKSIGPKDWVAISSLWRSAAFQNFTTDKTRLVATIDQIFGAKAVSPTIQQATSLEARQALSSVGGGNAKSESVAAQDVAYTEAKAIEATLLKAVNWMGDVRARSKSIVLVSEGIPPSPVDPADPFGLLESQMRQFEMDQLALATRRSSVPVYTVDPRGLTSLAEESVQVGGVSGLGTSTPADGLARELDVSRESLRRLAEDTGGYAIVSTNDFRGAFDSVVRRASMYYVLGYYSSNPRRDGKFRRVQVKVNHPDAHVAARNGYYGPVDHPVARTPAPGPRGSSELVRDALSAKFPMSALPMTMTAAPFRDKGSESSVAIVLEAPGSALELTEQSGGFAAPLQLLVSALDDRGVMKATEAKDLQFRLQPAVFARVQQEGFRWLSRLSVKPGKYQLRIAAAGSTKQGSVWYDLEVPDFSDGDLAMSGLLITSAARFATPTLRPDPQLAGLLPGPPTASREFPSGDELTVLAEVYDNRLSQAREFDVIVRVRTEAGREVFQLPDPVSSERIRAGRGVVRSITKIPLQVLAGRYVVSVEAARRGDSAHRIVREVPFTVIK